MDWSTFNEKESEFNWEKRDALMKQLQENPIEIDRVQLDYLCTTINSLRTTLQFSALNAVESIIKNVPIDNYAEILLAALYKVIIGSKKVVSQPAINVATCLIQHTTPNNRILGIFSNMSQDKNVVSRTTTVLLLTHFYNNTLPTNWLVKANTMDLFCKILDRLLHDASSSVREQARTLFLLFESTYTVESNFILQNVQDHIAKAILRERSKLGFNKVEKPANPIEAISSPKKTRSFGGLKQNRSRSQSRESLNSNGSIKSTPSAYLSTPQSRDPNETEAFFDEVMGKINKSFGDLHTDLATLVPKKVSGKANIEGQEILLVPEGPKDIDIPSIGEYNIEIALSDGDVENEIGTILSRTEDRFSIEDFNNLLSLSKQNPIIDEATSKIWNVPTTNALLYKIYQILNETEEDDSKEDAFIILQEIVVNQGKLLSGNEPEVLSYGLKYHLFDVDFVRYINLGQSSWFLLLYGLY
eukprot:NODE_54_length_30443_cov_1.442954.p5 type:complete len:472 gc:universal NODE_54_length_30443_cov_1.442954:19774-21189(+)